MRRLLPPSSQSLPSSSRLHEKSGMTNRSGENLGSGEAHSYSVSRVVTSCGVSPIPFFHFSPKPWKERAKRAALQGLGWRGRVGGAMEGRKDGRAKRGGDVGFEREERHRTDVPRIAIVFMAQWHPLVKPQTSSLRPQFVHGS